MSFVCVLRTGISAAIVDAEAELLNSCTVVSGRICEEFALTVASLVAKRDGMLSQLRAHVVERVAFLAGKLTETAAVLGKPEAQILCMHIDKAYV